MTTPLPEPLQAPHAAYTTRLARAKEELGSLDRFAALLANLRAVTFVAAAAFVVMRVFEKGPAWGWWGALFFGVLYVALARKHHQVIQKEDRAKVRVRLNERGLARLTGGWHAFPERGERFASSEHLYTPDLDVFGQGSLFQLMSEAATTAGEDRLAAWLSSPAGTETEIRERQDAAKELTPLLDFRQALLVECGLASKARANPSRFIAWAEGGPYLASVRWARPLAYLLPVATLTLYILGRFGVVHRALFYGGLLALLAVVMATRRTLAEFYGRIVEGENGFVRFEDTFARIEAQVFHHPRLQWLAGQLKTETGPRVSDSLRKFSRLFSFAELRENGQMHAVVNLFTLWDVHLLFQLEAWRKAHQGTVRKWFEALSELEALSCLAGLAHDRPQFVFPSISEGAQVLEATALGHPLLDEPVLNDVSLPGPGVALILTGSNMSGKTTLLRAMGANAVLALAGGPVCAGSLRLSRLQILTSMRVKDSLERGVSYFYAEVQRIKKVLDAAAAANGKALFLLDEILLGTNTRERQIASRELLKLLLKTGAQGAVTTHDLTLTLLAQERDISVRNMHFRDHLVDGQMRFDYQLREGVVETTNALRVLELAGIHLPPASPS